MLDDKSSSVTKTFKFSVTVNACLLLGLPVTELFRLVTELCAAKVGAFNGAWFLGLIHVCPWRVLLPEHLHSRTEPL